MADDNKRVKRRDKKNISNGVAHVNSTFNNTMITISDEKGDAISWSSAGLMGFKGSRKSTPFAAQMAAEDAGEKAKEHGVRTLKVEVQVETIRDWDRSLQYCACSVSFRVLPWFTPALFNTYI